MTTIPVRSGEELNKDRLETFLRTHMEDLPTGTLHVTQFAEGHSNLTYALSIDGWEAVLRRPPLGPVAPKAHNMEREFTFLKEIKPFFDAAPDPLIYTEDTSIIGAPFFIMERKHGVVLDTQFPEQIEPDPDLCRHISTQMAERLADLHRIDYTQTGLMNITRPDGFLKRQVEGWISRYQRAATDDIPAADQLMKWLQTHLPDSKETTVIHYDYKLNNAMFTNDLRQMKGLFDWEMATVGDPLADLGVALSYWIEAEDPDEVKHALGGTPVTTLPGFYTRDEFMHQYSLHSGRDLAGVHYYFVFAYFKLAVIAQQIYYRYQNGQTSDPRFASFGRTVKTLMKEGEMLRSHKGGRS
ncbi:phosphotransferase family protein [Sinobaca sp. H24]|uniref:phosphotransferase family protein n=1 Tax=Sinobaca sp. H24 TaxID=2923376 RepID=UPI002079CA1E|nr:phosphotransferase family protein [Sinobaca sp. H24]